VGSLQQEFVLRPDFEKLQMWVELAGYPRAADRFRLGPKNGDQYTWSIHRAGLHMSGRLKQVGNPPKERIQLHVDEASFEDWTVSDFMLHLDRVP